MTRKSSSQQSAATVQTPTLAQPLQGDLLKMPGHAIRRLQQISAGIFVQEIGDLNITPIQYNALRVVAELPGIDQRTLAGKVALDASTTGGVIERLEQRGWLRRETSQEDRRARLLFATPEGQACLQQVAPVVQRIQERILQPLNAEQQQQFMALLHQLVTTNNELSRAPGSL
ncbi:MAG: MarR family transcriptional regulator [Comamonas sp.]|nr:MarR family transcriptional regulator [Comamonas sp.]